MANVVPMMRVTAPQGPRMQGILDPLQTAVRQDNQLLALAVGGALSAVVVNAVEELTDVMSSWVGESKVFAPLAARLHVTILGGTLDIPRIISVLFYIVMSILVLAALVFGVLSPLIGSGAKRKKAEE
jgi:hypothetical protein